MKTIGIIGGLGPASTVKYYEWLTAGVNARLGGNHSARIIMTSVNGEDVKARRLSGDPAAEGAFFAAEAKRLETAGADFILITSNTSHKNAPAVEAAVSIPLLHLAEATAARVVAAGIKKIGLLGTIYTMEEDFYISRLQKHGLDVIVPEAADRAWISETIYGPLTRGIVTPETKATFAEIIARLAEQGVGGVILGCTELTLLSLPGSPVPLFDTTKIHVEEALNFALSAKD